MTTHHTAADTTAAVDQFMVRLQHRLKAQLQTVRELVLAADATILEGIKWNAPSFRTGDYFATTNLQGKAGVRLVLHLGAKVRDLPEGTLAIDDPAGLLKWLGKDRAMVEFRATDADVAERGAAVQALIRQWLRYV